MAQNIICCCGPKIWTTVVGWLEIVFTILAAITVPLQRDQTVNMLSQLNNETASQWDMGGIELYVGAWMSSAVIALNVLLLVGNEKERAGFLIPWLILNWIGVVLFGILLLIFLLVGFFPGVLVLLIGFILPALFMYAVHKRYNEIKEITEVRIPVPMHKV